MLLWSKFREDCRKRKTPESSARLTSGEISQHHSTGGRYKYQYVPRVLRRTSEAISNRLRENSISVADNEIIHNKREGSNRGYCINPWKVKCPESAK
jgi:hypothetical protein